MVKNKKGLSLLWTILLLILLSVGSTVVMYQENTGKEFPTEEIVGELNISDIEISYSEVNLPTRLIDAIEYWINGMLNAYEEIVKWGIEYAADNPDIPYKLLFVLLIIAILSPIIILVVKLLVIIYLLISEYILNKREKREKKSGNEEKKVYEPKAIHELDI